MTDYNNEAGLPPTIPPPDWIHNVSCYSPLLLQNEEALTNNSHSVARYVTVTRSVLNEYYKARSTKPADQRSKPKAQRPKIKAQSP